MLCSGILTVTATFDDCIIHYFCNQDRQIPSQQTSVPDDNDNNHRDHSPTQQSADQGNIYIVLNVVSFLVFNW